MEKMNLVTKNLTDENIQRILELFPNVATEKEDENGKLSNRMRVKALELLGFGVWENAQDINELHLKRAASENLKMLENSQVIEPLEVDEHDIHITEHTAFMLGGEFEKNLAKNPKLTEIVLRHIRKHKQLKEKDTESKIGDRS